MHFCVNKFNKKNGFGRWRHEKVFIAAESVNMFRLAVTNKTKTILEDVKRIICKKQWSFVEISRDSKLFAINMCLWHDAVHEYDDEKRNKLTWVKHYWTCFIESERVAATTIVEFWIRSPDLRLALTAKPMFVFTKRISSQGFSIQPMQQTGKQSCCLGFSWSFLSESHEDVRRGAFIVMQIHISI